MVKVLTTDDAKPKAVSDIEEIIPWNDTVPAYPYLDEDTGQAKLLYLDEKAKCAIFKKSEFMNGVGFIDAAEIAPSMYTGDHYFIDVQAMSKSEEPAASDIQGYSILFYILKEHKKMFLTKFVSGDREKFAVIYAVEDGLMLSIIIPHNYQRTAPTVSRIPLPKAKDHASKMLASFSLRRFDSVITCDKYEESIDKYIEDLKEVAKGGPTGKLKVKFKAPEPQHEDFFSQLEAL
jgi:non-homologous end joining protein Ku